MGVLLSLLSGLKAEFDWFFSTLTYVSAAADAPPADTPADTAHVATNDDAVREHASGDHDVTLATLPPSHADDARPHSPSYDADAGDFLHHVKADAVDGDVAPQAEHGGQLLTPVFPVTDFVVAPMPAALDALSGLSTFNLENVGTHKTGLDASHDDISFSLAPLYGNDLADIDRGAVFSFANGHGGGGHGGGGTTPPPDPWTTLGLSPLQITLNFDSSVGKAPLQFVSDIEYAAQYLADHFSDPAHIYINVGYGTVAGFRVPASALGESITNTALFGNYTNMYDALNADAASGNINGDGRKTLPDPTGDPNADPTGGGNFVLSTAEAKALGIDPYATAVDGSVGFSSFKNIFDYNIGEKPLSGQYDFVSVALHELTEVMGRMLFVGENVDGVSNSYDALDLFHFTGTNARTIVGNVAGYFSIDNGATHPHIFNSDASGDWGDWARGQNTTTEADSFDAFGGSGKVAPVHDFDITVMDAIGWDWNGTAWNSVPT